MKILFICNEYPPYIHGGIGTYTRDIAEGMVKAGSEITVFGLYKDEAKEEIINGVRVVRNSYLPILRQFNYLWFILIFNFKIRRFLKKNSFDIIECPEWQGLLPIGLKQKYIIRLHGSAAFFDRLLNRKGSRMSHFFEKKTIAKAKNVVAVSDFCGRETLKILGLEKNFAVIYNSVDTIRISSFRSDKTDRFSIVFANSVLPKKGIFELAEAFNIVSDSFPEASLTIIGKLGYQSQGKNVKGLIMERISLEKHKNVFIKGWLNSADDVYRKLSEAHVCCYPSHMEGFGIAPVEAMVLGKPVIFMKDGPGPEIIENDISGFLVDTFNSKAIADKITEIFSGKFDLNVIGANARKRAMELFDRDTVFIKKNTSFFKKVIMQ